MTVRSVFDVVRKYAERAGLGSDVTPHTLRHTFATELARKKVGPKVIRDLMGHSSASMTLSYIHYTDEEYTGSVGVLE